MMSMNDAAITGSMTLDAAAVAPRVGSRSTGWPVQAFALIAVALTLDITPYVSFASSAVARGGELITTLGR